MSTPSMSLIEKAAQRLEQLRRAGVEGVDDATPSPATVFEKLPTPEAAVRERARAAVAAEAGVDTATPVADAEAPAARVARPVFELDLDYLEARGFLTPESPRSQLSDEMRLIKRPLVRRAMGPPGVRVRNGNLIMVTSALPAEGKTFTSINLVMSLVAELDATVLLVDGDVAHPGLLRALGVPQSPGLLDLLTTPELRVGDALLRTNVPKLSILPAGSIHRRATELLASEQMVALLQDLGSHYADRIIVFDSPPLLAATEARVLATHMGQILMVVAADSTLQSEVNLALSTIESCEVVHMMLNKAARTDVGAYYGYFADDAR
jgi:receptor protein-tyrosine kinase